MNYFFLLIASAIPVVKICLLSLVGVALAHLVRGNLLTCSCLVLCAIVACPSCESILAAVQLRAQLQGFSSKCGMKRVPCDFQALRQKATHLSRTVF
jgi:hypothetical protein